MTLIINKTVCGPCILQVSFQLFKVYVNKKKLIFFQEKSQEDVSDFVQFFFQSLHACLAQSMNISIQGHVENTTDDLALHVCKFSKNIQKSTIYV